MRAPAPAPDLRGIGRRAFLGRGLACLAGGVVLGHGWDQSRRAKARGKDVNKADVIVIGAGVSGLGAAYTLREGGASVIVVEARGRTGGRVWTNRALGTPIDLGASWIHGYQGNPVYEAAEELKVETLATDYEDLQLHDFDGRKLSLAELASLGGEREDLERELAKLAEGRAKDLSWQAGVDELLEGERLNPAQQRMLDWALAVQETTFAADLSQLSLLEADEGEDFPGGDRLFPGGYDQLVRATAEGLDIRLNTHVTRVEHGGDRARVHTSRGVFEAEAAVVTLPLGVLKRADVAFDPALPAAKREAIKRLGFGTLNKVALAFPSAFWPVKRHFLGYMSKVRGEFPTFLNWRRYTEANALMAFSGGSFAERLEGKTDAAIVEDVMRVLRTMFGASIPAPTGTLISRWASDPYARGSYSHVPVGGRASDYEVMAEPASERLYFAGEATHKAHPSTVHGAWLSGVREGERLLRL